MSATCLLKSRTVPMLYPSTVLTVQYLQTTFLLHFRAILHKRQNYLLVNRPRFWWKYFDQNMKKSKYNILQSLSLHLCLKIINKPLFRIRDVWIRIQIRIAYSYHCITDQDPGPDPDPAIFFSFFFFQDGNENKNFSLCFFA
jgi:hypothetical protein